MVAPIFRAVFLVALVSLLTIAAPGIAAAADEAAAINKVTNLNRKALEAYSKQDYDTARTLLKEALEVCASAGLDKHAIRARTHIHFGAVAIVGFKQREVGLKQFRKALDVQPDIKLTKQLATPELQDAFEEAVLAGEGGGGGGAATAGGEPGGGGDDGGPAGAGGDDEGARPTAVKRPPPSKKKGEDEDESEGQKGLFFFGLTGGGGVGLVKGEGELDPNAHKLEGAGFAVAQTAQITPEIGVFVTPSLMISGQLRAQYVGGTNGKPGSTSGCGDDMFCTPGNGAFAGFAKVTYLLTERSVPSHAGRPGRRRLHSALGRVPERQVVPGVRHRGHPDLRRHAGGRSVPDRTHVRLLLRARRHGRPDRGRELGPGRPEVHPELRRRRRHRLSHLAFARTCPVSLTRQIC